MKRVQALVLVLAVFATSMASPVKAPAAMRKARQFVADKMGSRHSDKISLAYTSQNESAADDALFYVYNIGNDNGFVIIAGDDLATPVLGYTDRGSFSWDNMPDNLKIWLQYYKEAIAQVASRDVETAAPQARPSDVVEPLLSTRWDQTWPYNLLCPMSGNTQCPSGCVATAMAQVINYYQFPVEETNEIPSYYCSSLKKTMPALPPTTFEWDLMKNTYNRNSSEESKMAVAKLMQYCGQAVEMEYTASSAGAQTFDLPRRLPRFFKYPSTMHYVYHEGYSIAEWDSLLLKELKNNCPVLYTAYTTAWEGHAFVCDGYDGKGMYHINWGWGGQADGYYRISVLDASSSGTGGSSTSMRFTINQAALLGMRTTGDDDYVAPEEAVMFSTRPSLADGRHFERDSVGAAFPRFRIAGDFLPTGSYGYFTFGFALYDGDGQFVKTLSTRSEQLWQGYGSSESYVISGIGKDVENGHFTIRPVYKKNSGNWALAKGSDRHYVDVLIEGTNMQLTPVPKADFVVNKVSKSGQSLVVNLTNNDEEYNGAIILRKVNSNGEISVIAYEMVAIEANSTRTIYIYIDQNNSLSLDNDVFYLSVDYYDNVYFYTNVYNENADLACNIDVLNLTDDQSTIVGDLAICDVKVSNHGSGDYRHFLNIMLDDGAKEVTGMPFKKLLDLKAGESTTMTIELPIANYDSKLSVVATNYVDENENLLYMSDLYNVSKGAIYWNAKGQMKTCIAEDVLTVPEDALAIQLRNAYTSDVLPNSNPNTVYLLEWSIPNGLVGRNVLNAELRTGNLRFTDGYDFYIPVEMTATSSITYQRSFAPDEMGQWSTIALPFSPTKVTVDGKTVDWFRNADDFQKDFWLQDVASVEDDKVKLKYVDKMQSNHPYLIAPGEQLLGKTVEFRAGKTKLVPTADTRTNLSLGDYELEGTYVGCDLSGVYAQHGNHFVYNEDAQNVPAFRAYMLYTVKKTPAYTQLVIEGPDITSGITPVMFGESVDTSTVYDLSGRKVSDSGSLKGLSKGIYIIGGKKTVVR